MSFTSSQVKPSRTHNRSLLSRAAAVLRLQRDIINQSSALDAAEPATILAYMKRLHDPEFDEEIECP